MIVCHFCGIITVYILGQYLLPVVCNAKPVKNRLMDRLGRAICQNTRFLPIKARNDTMQYNKAKEYS